MRINLLRYCLRQCFQSLFRNFGLNLAAAGMVAVSLFVLGSFLLLGINADHLMEGLEANVEIGVFLEDNPDVEGVESELESMEGVEDYRFVSREEALEDMSQELGEEEMVGELEGEHNPLPHAFRVQAQDAEMVPELASEIEAVSGVEKADYGGELLSWLLDMNRWLNLGFLAAGGLLAAASLYLVVTSIRLSLLTRSEEVGIMKYLGASNWFIRFPFLLEGMIIGWLGTLLSLGVLAGGYYYLVSALDRVEILFFRQPVADPEVLLPVWVGLLALGTLIGGLGSLLSLRRFLKV